MVIAFRLPVHNHWRHRAVETVTGAAYSRNAYGFFMTIEGVLELLLSFQFRPVHNWSWMLFSGVVTLVFAMVLWIGFPAFDILYLGWVIAINLVFYGLSLRMLVWRSAS